MKKLVIMALVAAVLFASCGKESDPVKAKTKTELLTAKAWKQTGFTIDPGIDIGGGVVITDFWTQMESCEKDNTIKFETNNVGIEDEGATKCDPADAQKTTFAWTLSPTETRLSWDTDILDIETLDETTLKISGIADGDDIGGTPGIKYKITMTYKH